MGGEREGKRCIVLEAAMNLTAGKHFRARKYLFIPKEHWILKILGAPQGLMEWDSVFCRSHSTPSVNLGISIQLTPEIPKHCSHAISRRLVYTHQAASALRAERDRPCVLQGEGASPQDSWAGTEPWQLSNTLRWSQTRYVSVLWPCILQVSAVHWLWSGGFGFHWFGISGSVITYTWCCIRTTLIPGAKCILLIWETMRQVNRCLELLYSFIWWLEACTTEELISTSRAQSDTALSHPWLSFWMTTF